MMNEDIITLLSAEGDETEEIISTEAPDAPEAKDSNNALTSLAIMGKGMLGIFLVTVVIIFAIVLLNKFTSPKKSKPSEASDNG